MKRPPISPNHPTRHQIVARNPTPPPTPTPSRTLHLVDIDNLLADPRVTDARRIAFIFEAYRNAADYERGDHTVVATRCNPHHVLAVELGWPTARHCRRRGRDGADLVLLEEAGWAASSRRYDRVVLGSGDGIFLRAFDRLQEADISVDVVCRRQTIAHALESRAAGHVRYLKTG